MSVYINGKEVGVVLHIEDEQGGLKVSLPSTFYEANGITYIKLNENEYLISAEIGSKHIGVWLWEVSTNTLTQKYSSYAYNVFQLLPNGDCLISNRASNDVRDSGILLYDHITKQITSKYSTSRNYGVYHPLSNGDCIIGGGQTSNARLLLYDHTDKSISAKYTTASGAGNNWVNFQELDNGDGLLSAGGDAPGIIYYDSEAKTMSLEYNTGHWTHFKSLLNNKCLIASNKSDTTGILLFKNKTVTQIYSLNYSWVYSYLLSNGNCIVSCGRSDGGTLLFDDTTDTVSVLSSTVYGLRYCQETLEGDCLMSSVYSSVSGIYLYDSTNITFTKIYANGYQLAHFYILPNGYILISAISIGNSSGGVFRYDNINKTIARKYTIACDWANYKELSNHSVIISSISSPNEEYNGFLLYDFANDSITKKYNHGYKYDTFESIGNDCYISNPNITGNLTYYKLLYEYDTDSVTVKEMAHKIQ